MILFLKNIPIFSNLNILRQKYTEMFGVLDFFC
jgi:hypothetical protein